MPHEYTRQRQGRDFLTQKHLKNPKAEVRRNAARKEDEAKKPILNRLEQYKEESERNAIPIDGHEPPQEHPAPERGR